MALRARAIAQAITDVRVPSDPPGARATIVAVYPESVSPQLPQHARDLMARYIAARNFAQTSAPCRGLGLLGSISAMDADDATILGVVQAFVRE